MILERPQGAIKPSEHSGGIWGDLKGSGPNPKERLNYKHLMKVSLAAAFMVVNRRAIIR